MTNEDWEGAFLPGRAWVQAQFPPQPICWRALDDDEQVTRLHVVHAPTGALLRQFREVALLGRATRVAGVSQPEWTRS
jgi:hypothetical protein